MLDWQRRFENVRGSWQASERRAQELHKLGADLAEALRAAVETLQAVGVEPDEETRRVLMCADAVFPPYTGLYVETWECETCHNRVDEVVKSKYGGLPSLAALYRCMCTSETDDDTAAHTEHRLIGTDKLSERITLNQGDSYVVRRADGRTEHTGFTAEGDASGLNLRAAQILDPAYRET